MQRYECNTCKVEFLETDITPVEVFAGNREEPPEYEDQCPDCHSNDIEEITFPLCISCEDEQVHHEGDQCEECRTCQAEAIADAAKGH